MSDKLKHWGCISSIKSDNLTPFYTTLENNEEILFVDDDGVQRVINSLTLWTSADALYIQISESGDGQCIYLPANSSVSLDYLKIDKIKILAVAGVLIRYLALYY